MNCLLCDRMCEAEVHLRPRANEVHFRGQGDFGSELDDALALLFLSMRPHLVSSLLLSDRIQAFDPLITQCCAVAW